MWRDYNESGITPPGLIEFWRRASQSRVHGRSKFKLQNVARNAISSPGFLSSNLRNSKMPYARLRVGEVSGRPAASDSAASLAAALINIVTR